MKIKLLNCLLLFCFFTDFSACSDDNDDPVSPPIEEPVENGNGPSASDDLTIPTNSEFLGDSINQMLRYSLQSNPISIVNASTTQNGHIAVMGGYKDDATVYIYAKGDDISLSKEQTDAILSKYYVVKSEASGNIINASVTERTDITHESDYHKLRVSMKIFTPHSISYQLSLDNGSILVSNLSAPEHAAVSVNGAIKYMNTQASAINASATNGFISFINTTATESINAKLTKGSIQIAVPSSTKAHLNLSSNTNVTASLLNANNFSGTNTRTLVNGDLNGGGGSNINASTSYGSVIFKWY